MRKLAIVCGSPSSEMSAPFMDFDYDVWVLGNRCERYPRYTRIFEIHDDLSKHDAEYPHWLYMRGVDLVVGEKFPLSGDGIQVFPYPKTPYLTSSSACMLYLAIEEGYTHVELYGVDMAVDDHEYFWQRPCMEYWVGFARGRGVDVLIPAASPLCKSKYVEGRDYGSERPETPFCANEYSDIAQEHNKRAVNAAERLKQLEATLNEAEQLKAQIQAHGGAAQAYERMAKVQRAKDAGQTIHSLKDTVSIR